MGVSSAGVLVFRRTNRGLEFLLGHPGGPLWARKDLGAWMIPKGLVEPDEELLAAARREFQEETGLAAPSALRPLTPIRQTGGKTVFCWTGEAELELSAFRPGMFEMEWPLRSGKRVAFPEVDRVAYFETEAALLKILPSQAPLIREAVLILGEAA